MAFTFNGIGTTYYGKKKFEPDDSCVTTKWFVILFFPITPIESARVRFLSSSSLEIVQKFPIDRIQVLFTRIYAIFIISWIIYFTNKNISLVEKATAIVAGIALPHLIRWISKMKSNRA